MKKASDLAKLHWDSCLISSTHPVIAYCWSSGTRLSRSCKDSAIAKATSLDITIPSLLPKALRRPIRVLYRDRWAYPSGTRETEHRNLEIFSMSFG